MTTLTETFSELELLKLLDAIRRPLAEVEARCHEITAHFRQVENDIAMKLEEAQAYRMVADIVEPDTVGECTDVIYGVSELKAQDADWEDLRRTEADAQI